MPIVALTLLFLVSTAQAVVPFRLVTEIQLPARTIQWDVQHFEDSTSFGWVALTEGAPVIGYDEEGDEFVEVSAQDTFWFKSDLNSELDYMMFSRQGFNHLEYPLHWAELTLLRWPDHDEPVAVALATHYSDKTIRLYFLDLAEDTILASQILFTTPPGSGWPNNSYWYMNRLLSAWPNLPSTTDWLINSTNLRVTEYGSGDDYVHRYYAAGELFQIPSLTRTDFGTFSHQLFERSDSLDFAYFAGNNFEYWGCDWCPEFDRRFSVGIGHFSDSLVVSHVDSIETWGRVYAQEDLDGTKRILHTNGDCYDAVTGEIVFSNPSIPDTCMSAYARNAPGEDFLYFQAGRFQIYDGRTGEWVDSTSVIQGIPQYTLVTNGFDQLVTYDVTQKLVRVYQSLSTLLSINVTDGGQVQLSWTASTGAVGYRLDSSGNFDFTSVYSDFYSPATTSVTVTPNAPIKFFRVTPLFE